MKTDRMGWKSRTGLLDPEVVGGGGEGGVVAGDDGAGHGALQHGAGQLTRDLVEAGVVVVPPQVPGSKRSPWLSISPSLRACPAWPTPTGGPAQAALVVIWGRHAYHTCTSSACSTLPYALQAAMPGHRYITNQAQPIRAQYPAECIGVSRKGLGGLAAITNVRRAPTC